jgi:pimeloyl-ACP methyl ester carboxylesterase
MKIAPLPTAFSMKLWVHTAPAENHRSQSGRESRWHYLQAGQGENLLLLHGLGASVFSWRHNLDPLGRFYQVLALDLKGCGDSSVGFGEDYSLEALALEVLAFMDNLGVKRTALAGNSLGGSVALMLAQRFPERVSALVLLAPAVFLSRLPWIVYPLKLPVVSWLSVWVLGPWVIPLALRLAYHDPRLITPEVVAGYARPFRSLKKRLVLRELCGGLHLWSRPQLQALLAAVRQPTLIIWGEQDRILPPAQAWELKQHLSQAELHLLPGVGHAPQEENPLQVNKIMIDFLNRSFKMDN